MAKSFFIVKCNSCDGYYDDREKYHAMVYSDPNDIDICYCETYDDAKKMLIKESRKEFRFEWMELEYFKESKDKITKRYAEYDKRKHRYTEGIEVSWWITEINFTKP